MHEQNLWLADLPEAPVFVKHPLEARTEWSCINWNRQTYEQMMGIPVQV